MTGSGIRRRGFATTMAIMFIALVGVALAAMSARLATVARQGRQEREAAQLRELLHAGTRFARSSPADGRRAVELPARLKDGAAELTVEVKGRQATVEGSIGTDRASHIVAFDESGDPIRVRLVD
jgi:type II secretory pathway component PulK